MESTHLDHGRSGGTGVEDDIRIGSPNPIIASGCVNSTTHYERITTPSVVGTTAVELEGTSKVGNSEEGHLVQQIFQRSRNRRRP